MNPIYVSKPIVPPLEEYVKELSDIWNSRILTNAGTKHNALEVALSKYFSVPYFYLFTNGHMALEAALQVLGLPSGGEVITTPFTFASTTMAILRSGLTPIFCDIKDSDGTMNPSLIESLISPKTCAIMPVHVYGNLCDVDEISAIAKKYGLPVIYDAAHAFGVKREIDGKSAAAFGDISMLSFHATKVFHAFEGGGLALSDPLLAEKLVAWRNFGHIDGEVTELGCNAKMSEAHAAMGLCNLRYVGENIALRKRNTETYEKLLRDCPGLTIIPIQEGVIHNYSYFPIRIDSQVFGKSRDEVCETLAVQKIYARKYFYPLTSDMPIYGGKPSDMKTPVAKKLAEEILTLPLYPDLSENDIKRICETILGG